MKKVVFYILASVAMMLMVVALNIIGAADLGAEPLPCYIMAACVDAVAFGIFAIAYRLALSEGLFFEEEEKFVDD